MGQFTKFHKYDRNWSSNQIRSYTSMIIHDTFHHHPLPTMILQFPMSFSFYLYKIEKCPKPARIQSYLEGEWRKYLKDPGEPWKSLLNIRPLVGRPARHTMLPRHCAKSNACVQQEESFGSPRNWGNVPCHFLIWRWHARIDWKQRSQKTTQNHPHTF